MKTKSILLLLTGIFVSIMLSAQTLPPTGEDFDPAKYKEWVIQHGYDHFNYDPFLHGPYVSDPYNSASNAVNYKYNGNQNGGVVNPKYQEEKINLPISMPFKQKFRPRIRPGFPTASNGRGYGAGF